MTIKEYVDDLLCVPVTRVGNRYIVEAIELVVDTHEHKFYAKLADLHKTTPRYLEKAMRDAKNLGLSYMETPLKQDIFNKEATLATNEYVIKAAEYYRRMYEDKN